MAHDNLPFPTASALGHTPPPGRGCVTPAFCQGHFWVLREQEEQDRPKWYISRHLRSLTLYSKISWVFQNIIETAVTRTLWWNSVLRLAILCPFSHYRCLHVWCAVSPTSRLEWDWNQPQTRKPNAGRWNILIALQTDTHPLHNAFFPIITCT